MKKEDRDVVKNAVTCTICGAPADRFAWGYQCQKNHAHLGALSVGIFTDRASQAKPSI